MVKVLEFAKKIRSNLSEEDFSKLNSKKGIKEIIINFGYAPKSDLELLNDQHWIYIQNTLISKSF